MTKIKKDLKHIHKDQLPDRIQVAMDKNGFSIYRGVIIVWGETLSKKIIEVADTVVDKYPGRLLIVHFEDNLLEMIWNDECPPEFGHTVTNTDQGRIEMIPFVYEIPVFFSVN